MKWYWHVTLRWPGESDLNTVMVAESEAEVRDVWKHYEVVRVRRGNKAYRKGTVES